MLKAAAVQEHFQRYKSYLLIFLLLVFHSVGFFGIISDSREYFLGLTPMNLTISFIIILIARIKHSISFYLFVLGAFFTGMIVEWVGVHTGFLFGDYIYGKSLGVKWYGVPLVIGMNWVMLTIISASVVDLTKFHWLLKALSGTFLMLLLDFLIEPVAIVSDYWLWSAEIPFSNFVGWFIVALFLQLWYFRYNLAEPNKVCIALYLIQLVFFAGLNLV